MPRPKKKKQKFTPRKPQKEASPSDEKSFVIYNLRVDRSLRDSFNETCKQLDSTGSQEIRRFMRQYIAKNGQKTLI